VLALVLAPGLAVLATLLAVKSALSALFTVTEATAVKDTVPPEELVAANALTSFVNQSTKIVGPAIGGVLFAVTGAASAFVVNAATFLLAAAFLTRLRLASDTEPADATGRVSLREVTAGFRFVAGLSVLRTALLSLSLTVFLAFVFDTLTPLLVADLALSPEMLGISIGAVGAGSAVGALAIGQWAQAWPPLRLMSVAQAAAGALVAAAGLLAVLGARGPVAGALLVAVMAGVGFAAAGIFIGYPTIIQAATPARMMGRVMAVAQVLPTSLQLVAPVVGAALAEVLGVGVVFAVAGGGLAVLGLAFLGTQSARWRPGVPAPGSVDVPPSAVGTSAMTRPRESGRPDQERR
jgi:MFS family permease